MLWTRKERRKHEEAEGEVLWYVANTEVETFVEEVDRPSFAASLCLPDQLRAPIGVPECAPGFGVKPASQATILRRTASTRVHLRRPAQFTRSQMETSAVHAATTRQSKQDFTDPAPFLTHWHEKVCKYTVLRRSRCNQSSSQHPGPRDRREVLEIARLLRDCHMSIAEPWDGPGGWVSCELKFRPMHRYHGVMAQECGLVISFDAPAQARRLALLCAE